MQDLVVLIVIVKQTDSPIKKTFKSTFIGTQYTYTNPLIQKVFKIHFDDFEKKRI